MAKLRFDPVIYQFYYQRFPQESAPAKAAGFEWDPIRGRYYTEDPSVAVNFEASADSCAKLLLADVFSAAPSHKHQECSREASAWMSRSKAAVLSSPAFTNGTDAAPGDRPTANAKGERPNHERAHYTMPSDGQNRRPQPCPFARDGDVRRGFLRRRRAAPSRTRCELSPLTRALSPSLAVWLCVRLCAHKR